MTEYHGWITLRCTGKMWADDDWDAAHKAIAGEIAKFSVEDGHSIALAETTNAMQSVLLSGRTDESIEVIVALMEFVGRAVPDSYGELVSLDEVQADLRVAARYKLSRGQVLRYDQNQAA